MSRLQDFMADLLAQEGALVERIDPEGLEVLAPPSVQEWLRVQELTRLGFGAELPARAERVGLEGDWLERVGGLLRESGRRMTLALDVDNRAPGDPERVLAHGLVLLNAVYRLVAVRPVWTRYLLLRFHFTALSDENRDGVLEVGLNLATGAVLDDVVEDLWSHAVAGEMESPIPEGTALPPGWEREKLHLVLERIVADRVRLRLAHFLAGMQRRMERDQTRLHTYHNDMRRESLTRLGALPGRGEGTARQEAERRRLEQRLGAVAREYGAKTHDLRSKYAMKVAVDLVQTLDLTMPVCRFELLVRRRKGERRISLDWNPLARRLETAPCEFSYTRELPRMVCDDSLHLICPEAYTACPGCGKAFCRACHPRRCPKCDRPVRAVADTIDGMVT
jgi:hypothetical protein